MTIARSTIIRGPAIIEWDGAKFFSEGDIIVTPNFELFDINTSIFGKVDARVSDIIVKVEMTLAGEWENLAKLFPHTSPVIGSSIFGATDKNLIIRTLAGQKLTYKAGAITKMPNITFSAVKTLLGSVEFTAIGADNEAWSATEHKVAVGAEAFSDATFDPADILTQPYTVTWGASSWDTEQGVSVEFDLSVVPVKVDSYGTVDMTLESLEVSAKFIPVGISESELITLLKMQGAGVQRGYSLLDNSENLVIAGTGVAFTMFNAAPHGGPFKFGRSALRVGEVAMRACRSFTAGAADPVFSVA